MKAIQLAAWKIVSYYRLAGHMFRTTHNHALYLDPLYLDSSCTEC